jgi:hypothetical protein
MICSLLNRLLLIGSAPSKGAELQFTTVLLQGVRPVGLFVLSTFGYSLACRC